MHPDRKDFEDSGNTLNNKTKQQQELLNKWQIDLRVKGNGIKLLWVTLLSVEIII